MSETIINLKPQEKWRSGMSTDKLFAELDKALQFPGVANRWTMQSIFLRLYFNFQRTTETLIVMLSVPFAMVGGMISSTVLTLAVILAIYALIMQRRLAKRGFARLQCK